MSFVPQSSDATLWVVLGASVTALTGLEVWSRRERLKSDRIEIPEAHPGGEAQSAPSDDDGRLRRPE